MHTVKCPQTTVKLWTIPKKIHMYVYHNSGLKKNFGASYRTDFSRLYNWIAGRMGNLASQHLSTRRAMRAKHKQACITQSKVVFAGPDVEPSYLLAL